MFAAISKLKTSSARRLFNYLKPHRRDFFIALFFMVLYGSTDGVIPLLLKTVLDEVFGNQNERMLWLVVIGIIALSTVRGVAGFLQKYLSMSVGLRIVRDIRNEISRHLLKLDAAFFSGQSTGNLITRMTNDTLLIQKSVVDGSVAFIRDSVRVVALLGTAIWLDPVLAVIAFIGVPMAVYPVLRFGRTVKRLSKVGQDQLGALTARLHEIIAGHKIIQSFNMQEAEAARFEEDNENTTRTYIKAEKYGALSRPSNEIVASIAIAGVLLYGGYSVISGTRTQGDFIAFLSAMFLMYEPLKKLGKLNSTIQTGLASAERVFELLDVEPRITTKVDAIRLETRTPEIRYENVSFSYQNTNDLSASSVPDIAVARDTKTGFALQNINLTIQPGETLALVGMSGGGKSTIVNLLPRLYDPTHGAITINGIDIRNYTLESLRDHIAVVSQHTFLFDDSVSSNIAGGDTEPDQARIEAAAKAAFADEFIARLPQGYDTSIGEQGLRLSGGERARIAIARALYKDAPILILDEATASLDSEAEKLVQDAIEKLMQGRTVLVIAHRLSTVRNADRIAAIVNGQVAELGTHEALLQGDGEYAKLHRIQFGSEQDTKLVAPN